MRLVRCKKCGTPVLMDSTYLETMYVAMQECSEKARTAKVPALKQSYVQEAGQIRKMIAQFQHRTAQMEERKNVMTHETTEIVAYIRANKLITDEKLDELRALAREKAAVRNAEDERELQKIYGEFESMMTNRSAKDPTANEALKKL